MNTTLAFQFPHHLPAGSYVLSTILSLPISRGKGTSINDCGCTGWRVGTHSPWTLKHSFRLPKSAWSCQVKEPHMCGRHDHVHIPLPVWWPVLDKRSRKRCGTKCQHNEMASSYQSICALLQMLHAFSKHWVTHWDHLWGYRATRTELWLLFFLAVLTSVLLVRTNSVFGLRLNEHREQ